MIKERLFTTILTLVTLVSLVLLSSCQSSNNGSHTSNVTTNVPEIEPNSLSSDNDSFVQENTTVNGGVTAVNVELNNTYTTKYGKTNAITYPPFSFDYPNGWKVTEENVIPLSEIITLTNDRGARVTFSYIGGEKPGGGSTAVMREVEVSRVADAGFIPGYVQASDFSKLGNFMVAELKVVGTMDMQTDEKYTKVDGGVSYAVLPESFEGLHSGLRHPDMLDFSFEYAGNIALIADAPDGGFTEQEKQEAIAILASFREENASPKATDGQAVVTIEDLWLMLEGNWVFEEFLYDGNHTTYSEHDLEFRYVDKTPAMITHLHRTDGYARDVLFYDFAAIDEFNYDVYTYKRGSYGGEGANWGSDVQLVWWSFDLSNLSSGDISMTYNIATDKGIDNRNTFKYSRE